MEPLSSDVLHWVEHVIGHGAAVTGTEVLKAKKTQPTWLLHLDEQGRSMRAVLKVSPLGWEGGVSSEATALELLKDLGIPAPGLLGVNVDGRTGSLLLLQTYLPGSNSPETQSPLLRMRAFGAATAHLHGARLPVDHRLPHIDRPVWHDHYIPDRQEGRAPTTPLLQAAEQVWASIRPPDHDEVLVHGDHHHGNVLWKGDTVIALIDWDGAGAGNPGLDLGWARLEATFAYSTAAADEIAYGWTDVTGHSPENLAYWDMVAALQNHAHIGDRTDGRDQFLVNALEQLDTM
jgi:aminoglycoside phosphotransferase (APT) family kinase protein